jgi:hypothetical protein
MQETTIEGQMGVPLLDISCPLLSSLVCTRPYRQMIGISLCRGNFGARGTLLLMPACQRRDHHGGIQY